MALALGVIVATGRGGAGHSVGHFPSYYPDEIRIDVVEPEAAASGLADATLHAYVGSLPKFTGPVPSHVKSAKSLGSFLVLSLDAGLKRFASADDRCAAARGFLAALSQETAGGFVYHPHPVTPFHADYLHHVDRIEAARAAVDAPPAPRSPIAAQGELAEAIVRARGGSGRRSPRRRHCTPRRVVGTSLDQGRLVPRLSPAGARSRRGAAASRRKGL
jgi:hypothetical protein